MFITTFVVSGRGSFPTDMLRYDTCWPVGSVDVERISHREDGLRDVTLQTTHKYKGQIGVTEGRWNSFGWGVQILRTEKVAG